MVTPNNQPKKINLGQRSRRINSEDKLIDFIYTKLGHPMIQVDVTEDQVKLAIDEAIRKWTDYALEAQENQVIILNTQQGIKDYILDDRVMAIYDCSITDTTTSYAKNTGSGIDLGGFGMVPVNYIPYVDPLGNVSSLERGGGEGAGSIGVAGAVSGPHSGGGSDSDAMERAYSSMVYAQTMQNLFGTSISFDYNASNHILRFFNDVQGPVALEVALEYIPNPEHDDAYNHPWIKEYSLNLVKLQWGTNTGKYSSPLIGGAEINYSDLKSEAQSELERLNEELIERFSEPLGIFSA